MSDRFKFRLYDKLSNKYWISGNINTDGNVFVIPVDSDEKLYLGYDTVIVEQCTGLKDKNGNLIYEGDIIHEVDKEADIDDVSQIVWNQDTCHFMKLDLPDTKLNRHCLICEADSPYIEIIGNIHEQAKQKDKK